MKVSTCTMLNKKYLKSQFYFVSEVVTWMFWVGVTECNLDFGRGNPIYSTIGRNHPNSVWALMMS